MKEIVILGDIEIGGGNLTDDFISDNAFYELVNSYCSKKNPVDLVLNGDTFDFLSPLCCLICISDARTSPACLCQIPRTELSHN